MNFGEAYRAARHTEAARRRHRDPLFPGPGAALRKRLHARSDHRRKLASRYTAAILFLQLRQRYPSGTIRQNESASSRSSLRIAVLFRLGKLELIP